MSRRLLIRAARIAAAGVIAAGCGATGTAPPKGAEGPVAPVVDSAVLVQVHTRVLVDGRGYPLYLYVPDHRRAVTCASVCAQTWPPLASPPGTRPEAGAGVRAALLGTDANPTGGRVVTYGGWPLYTYSEDPQPDFATGQALDIDGGYWYLVRPDGTALTRSS